MVTIIIQTKSNGIFFSINGFMITRMWLMIYIMKKNIKQIKKVGKYSLKIYFVAIFIYNFSALIRFFNLIEIIHF